MGNVLTTTLKDNQGDHVVSTQYACTYDANGNLLTCTTATATTPATSTTATSPLHHGQLRHRGGRHDRLRP